MSIEHQRRMEDALERQLARMAEVREEIQDEKGQLPPGLSAETDQFFMHAKGLLDILVRHVREHREQGMKCCLLDEFCTGPEVMLAISVTAETSLAHLLGATTVAVGRLGSMPPTEEGGPHDG